MIQFLFSLFVLCSSPFLALANEESYEFLGKHFFASYMECELEAIGNVENLIAAMDEAVETSGATILDSLPYVFQPNGLTMVYLLSESHASIHTYPEHRACFVDLFTCGDHCSWERFDQKLRAYLKPKEVSGKLFLRHGEIEEISSK